MAKAELIFWISGGFILGVALASFKIFFPIILGFLFLVLVFSYFKSFSKTLTLVFIFSIFAGMVYFHFFLRFQDSRLKLPSQKKFEVIVLSEPKVFEKYQSFNARLNEPYYGNVEVITNPFPSYKYGDLLSLDGEIEKDQKLIQNPKIIFPKIEILKESRGNFIKQKLLIFKGAFVDRFNIFLSPNKAALLEGLTLGVRGNFSENFREAMKRSGTTHLVALSGYNIAIIISNLSLILFPLFGRKKSFYLLIVAVILFCVMVGGEASVVRAAIMGLLILLAREEGRVYTFKNSISIAASLMILWDPRLLKFDAGFQLSFLSLLGIVYLAPAIRAFFKSELNKITEMAILTLSAQIAVLPVLLLIFGSFSLMAILTNILILEFVPLVMLLGFVLAILGFSWAPLGFLISWFLNILLGYMIGIIYAGARFGFIETSGKFLFPLSVVYYFLIIIFIIRNYGRKQNFRQTI